MDRKKALVGQVWLHLWPGLSRLWLAGNPAGLLSAVLFSVLLNICLICTFIWTHWVPVHLFRFLWLATGVVWMTGLIQSLRYESPQAADAVRDPQLDLFLAARGEYLRGDWAKTEESLRQILGLDPRDVEARLMWATLLRHRGEADAAREQLRNLQRLEGAAGWNMEIQQEWHHLATNTTAKPERSDSSSSPLEAQERLDQDSHIGRAA